MPLATSFPALRGKRRLRQHSVTCANADWDAEMSLFRKRLSSPNQLATMRLLEAQVDVGRVRPRSPLLPVLAQGGEMKDRHVAAIARLRYHRPVQTLLACPHIPWWQTPRHTAIHPCVQDCAWRVWWHQNCGK